MQPHMRMRIHMLDAAPGLGGVDLHTNLFREFAFQRRQHGLSRLDFPAGEFPITCIGFAFRPTGEQTSPWACIRMPTAT